MIIKELQFYILANRIKFTLEKSCKGNKYFNTNQINLTIMAKFLKRHWAKDLEIETYITKGGKVRATINGKKPISVHLV